VFFPCHLAVSPNRRGEPGGKIHDAAAIAVQAVTLRDGYDPIARIELFAELAAHFRSLVEFPEQALEGVTDEQYVRSVLRVIYTG